MRSKNMEIIGEQLPYLINEFQFRTIVLYVTWSFHQSISGSSHFSLLNTMTHASGQPLVSEVYSHCVPPGIGRTNGLYTPESNT